MPQFDQSGFDTSGFDSSGSTAPPSPVPVYRVFGAPGSAPSITYGQLRFRLTKALPGIDPELIDGWIQDRYTQVLDELPWQRLEKTVAFQTTAPYNAGTVAIANGDTVLTLTGGAFTPAMTGRSFRISTDQSYYELTQTGPQTASIDRPYEGVSGAGLGYSIFQTVYQLPADLRILSDARLLTSPHPLDRVTRAALSLLSADRDVSGDPQFYAPYMDDQSAPPRPQVEIFPVPASASTIVIDYVADAAPLGGSSVSLLPWIRPAVLYEGVLANGLRQLKDYQGAQLAMVAASGLLAQMKRIEYARTPPTRMRMGGAFSRHRLDRALRATPQQVRLP